MYINSEIFDYYFENGNIEKYKNGNRVLMKIFDEGCLNFASKAVKAYSNS